MDSEPSLKVAARKLAGVLHRYAASRGWHYAPYGDFSRGDYYIDILANVEWSRFDVTLVAKALGEHGSFDEFNKVQDWIEANLKDDPALAEAVDIVVRSPKEYAEGRGSLGLGDMPIDDALIMSAIPSGQA